jgi:hypothetical protein
MSSLVRAPKSLGQSPSLVLIMDPNLASEVVSKLVGAQQAAPSQPPTGPNSQIIRPF